MTTRFRKRPLLLLPLLLLVVLSKCVRVLGEEEEEKEVEEKESNNFLYDSEDALPVMEYHAKDEREQQSGPDFIYAPNNGPRLVVSVYFTKTRNRYHSLFFVFFFSQWSSSLHLPRNSTLPGVRM